LRLAALAEFGLAKSKGDVRAASVALRCFLTSTADLAERALQDAGLRWRNRVMPIRTAFIAILYAASVTAAGAEPLVRHAGEWETRIDNGKPIILCFPTDVTLDQNYVLQSMSKLPDATCKVTNMTTVGAVTSYSMQCTIGGSLMTSTGTITATGPDSFTGKAHSHDRQGA
jgi:hypothetical protein